MTTNRPRATADSLAAAIITSTADSLRTDDDRAAFRMMIDFYNRNAATIADSIIDDMREDLALIFEDDELAFDAACDDPRLTLILTDYINSLMNAAD